MARTRAPDAVTDNVPLAVGVILFTVFALSLGDALVKLTSGTFALWQIFVLRSLIAIPVLLAVLRVGRPAALRIPAAPGWVALRSLLLVAMWVIYYLSLPHVPLPAAAAAYYTLPIFITLFSAAFTGDRVGRGGWLAVLLGFGGVVLILRPAAADFNAYALLPILSAMLYAAAMILTRTRCRAAHPLALSLALNLAFVLVGGAATILVAALPDGARQGFLLAPWAAMGAAEWRAIGLMAAAILVGSLGAAIAYQTAPPATVGTFDFAYVGFSVVWSAAFFAELPGPVAVLGMALIVGAGVIALRSRRDGGAASA